MRRPHPDCRAVSAVGEIAVVDLNAALGQGSNSELVAELCKVAKCRVGGGFATWIPQFGGWVPERRGVLGTAAVPEVLRELPPERGRRCPGRHRWRGGCEGWQRGTGGASSSGCRSSRGLAGGFLVTSSSVRGGWRNGHEARKGDCRGSGCGARDDRGRRHDSEDVAALDRLGRCPSRHGALTGRLDLADAVCRTDDHGSARRSLAHRGRRRRRTALGLTYSISRACGEAIRTRKGVYRSRKRGLW